MTRVLRYLEAEALGQAAPDYAVHLLGDLLHAAQLLGLRSLQVQSVATCVANATLHLTCCLMYSEQRHAHALSLTCNAPGAGRTTAEGSWGRWTRGLQYAALRRSRRTTLPASAGWCWTVRWHASRLPALSNPWPACSNLSVMFTVPNQARGVSRRHGARRDALARRAPGREQDHPCPGEHWPLRAFACLPVLHTMHSTPRVVGGCAHSKTRMGM